MPRTGTGRHGDHDTQPDTNANSHRYPHPHPNTNAAFHPNTNADTNTNTNTNIHAHTHTHGVHTPISRPFTVPTGDSGAAHAPCRPATGPSPSSSGHHATGGGDRTEPIPAAGQPVSDRHVTRLAVRTAETADPRPLRRAAPGHRPQAGHPGALHRRDLGHRGRHAEPQDTSVGPGRSRRDRSGTRQGRPEGKGSAAEHLPPSLWHEVGTVPRKTGSGYLVGDRVTPRETGSPPGPAIRPGTARGTGRRSGRTAAARPRSHRARSR